MGLELATRFSAVNNILRTLSRVALQFMFKQLGKSVDPMLV
jgi:hypothetical protein